MKRIWNETIGAGNVTYRWYDSGDYSYDYGRLSSCVREKTYYIGAQTVAYYDKATGTLRIEHTATGSEHNWMLDPVTILETHSTREQALRSVMTAAADWCISVRLSVPPSDERTDEQVEADYNRVQEPASIQG